MGQEARVNVEIREFPGLLTDPDQGDIPPGASEEQVNVASSSAGDLTSRGGLRRVLFED